MASSDFEAYVPELAADFPRIKDFLAKYQVRAAAEKIDQLGFYLPPFAYAAMQIIEKAVSEVRSLDQARLATFDKNGEWGGRSDLLHTVPQHVAERPRPMEEARPRGRGVAT